MKPSVSSGSDISSSTTPTTGTISSTKAANKKTENSPDIAIGLR